MLTLLRPDCRAPHSAGNAMLVPRLKFLCIELARNREGLNDAQALSQHQHQQEASEPSTAAVSGNGNGGQQQQQQPQQQQQQQQQQQFLEMRRTRKFSAIDVVGSAPQARASSAALLDAEDEEMETAVEALMAQQGIGEDASEEGAS
jgi:hypothetical protein